TAPTGAAGRSIRARSSCSSSRGCDTPTGPGPSRSLPPKHKLSLFDDLRRRLGHELLDRFDRPLGVGLAAIAFGRENRFRIVLEADPELAGLVLVDLEAVRHRTTPRE